MLCVQNAAMVNDDYDKYYSWWQNNSEYAGKYSCENCTGGIRDCRFNPQLWDSSSSSSYFFAYWLHAWLMFGIGSCCLILTLSKCWKPRSPFIFYAFVVERIIFNIAYGITMGSNEGLSYGAVPQYTGLSIVYLALIDFPFVYFCLWTDSQNWCNLTLDGDLTTESVDRSIEMLKQPLVRYMRL